MQPEREVAIAAAIVHDPGHRENGQSEPYRHPALGLEIGMGSAAEPRRQIHRHEPQRERDDRNDKGEAEVAQRDDAGDNGRDLHEDPAALHPDVEVLHGSRLAELAPPAQLVLDAVDRERRHRDRDRDQQAAGNPQILAVPEIVPGHAETGGVGDRAGRERPAAHLGERERREQAHGADHDQRTGVPEHVRGIEFGGRACITERRRHSPRRPASAPGRQG